MQNLVNTQTVAALDINVREQVSRHLSVSPNTDPKMVIELTPQQETERQKQKLGRLKVGSYRLFHKNMLLGRDAIGHVRSVLWRRRCDNDGL